MSYTNYAFTIKNNSKFVNPVPSTYDECIEKFKQHGCKVLYKYYENDSKDRLHVHGAVRIPDSLYRKTLMIKNYHLCLRRIYNMTGWCNYCKKDTHGDIDYYATRPDDDISSDDTYIEDVPDDVIITPRRKLFS